MTVRIDCIGRRGQLDVEFDFDRHFRVIDATLYSENNERTVKGKWLDRLYQRFEVQIQEQLEESDAVYWARYDMIEMVRDER